MSAIVPVYGCAAALPELVERLAQALDEVTTAWEILLVDDASPDGSADAARRLADRRPRVSLLRLDRNRGQQCAVLAGLSRARGAWAVVLDCDLQDPPEAIPSLLAHGRRSGAAAVFAGRRGAYQGPARRLTSALFRPLRRRLGGVPRDAGLFVALERHLVDQLLERVGSRPRVVPMIGLSGLPLASLPVVRARRSHGASSYSPWGRLRSGLAEVAWAAGHRLGLGSRRRVDPAEWIIETYSPPEVEGSAVAEAGDAPSSDAMDSDALDSAEASRP